MSRRLLLIAALVVVVGAVSGGIAIASGVGDDDEPLTGSSLAKASAAALAHTGGGTVVETEVGDDGAAYGVEVQLSDGRVVEVHLDSSYSVIGQEADDDGAEGGGEEADD
jgi:hypothetical protein